jgi:hypothetical protein
VIENTHSRRGASTLRRRDIFPAFYVPGNRGGGKPSRARPILKVSAKSNKCLVAEPSGFDFAESFAFGFAEPPVVAHRAKPGGL